MAITLPWHFPFLKHPEVTLIRAHTNEVFRVKEGNDLYAYKIYGTKWRTTPEIRYELELLSHLADRGINVVRALPDNRGRTVQHYYSLDRPFFQTVLFTFASGAPAVPPFSTDLYYREGAVTAALHAASDDFTSLNERRPLDRVTLVERARRAIREAGRGGEPGRWLDRFGQELGRRLPRSAVDGLDWGPCHGDLTFDNLHITHDGEFVWYDFDSGGPGWRAMDLQGWMALDPAMQERQDAFIAGYRTVRPLHDRNVEASRYLAAALDYQGIGIDLAYRVGSKGAEAVEAFLGDAVIRMERWRRVLALGEW
ncbi:MAG: phosphotransferase [Thermomicrobiales bacterium]